MKIFLKVVLKIILGILVFALIGSAYFYFRFRPADEITWGVSYSMGTANYLGLNAEVTYLRMLDELKPKKIRLMAYWEDLEMERGKFNFSQMDWMLLEAEKREVKVLLVVGHKQPRWPECHHPTWYENLDLVQRQEALLSMLEVTVNHFKTFSAISAWQVENEPFFDFGPNCETKRYELVAEEVALVKSIDNKPIVLTDSGEKGNWHDAASLADIFGATMYRTVYHSRFERYITYPLPPAFYRIRGGILQTFQWQKPIIGVELQAEPWYQSTVFDSPVEKQKELMNPEIFSDNINYARRVGFSENYLWGVEWWYWLEAKHGDSSMLDAAKEVFRN